MFTNLNNVSFNTILQQQTTNTVKSNYTNYSSKKQLLTSTQFNSLSSNVQNFIIQLKNCFSFSVHNNLQYIVITMYFTSTKQYSFYVVNCTQCTVVQFNTIQQSKLYILNCLTTNNSTNNSTTTNSTKTSTNNK